MLPPLSSAAVGDVSATWGNINGTLSNQTDLQAALDAKATKLTAQAVSSNISLSDGKVFLVDTTASRTLTLPAASANLQFHIKDVSGQAATNNITVARAGSEDIEGVAANKTLASDWGSWHFFCDGVDWWII